MEFYPNAPAISIDWPPGSVEDCPEGQRVVISPVQCPGFIPPPPDFNPQQNAPIPVTPPYKIGGRVVQGYTYDRLYAWQAYYLYESAAVYPYNPPVSFYAATHRDTNHIGGMISDDGIVYFDSPAGWSGYPDDIGGYKQVYYRYAPGEDPWRCTYQYLEDYEDMEGDGTIDDVHYYTGYTYEYQEDTLTWGYHDYISSGRQAGGVAPVTAILIAVMLPLLFSLSPLTSSASSSSGNTINSAGRRRKT